MVIVAFQTELRPELPEINGSKDYREFRATLEDMDRILVKSGIEYRFKKYKGQAVNQTFACSCMWRGYSLIINFWFCQKFYELGIPIGFVGKSMITEAGGR